MIRSLLAVGLFLCVACQSAYFATMEKFGVSKREILVDRVEDARGSQEDAKTQFQSTLDAFQALTGFDGGELEDLYENLEDEYGDSVDAADDVRDEIDGVVDVAEAMFEEWEGELDEITDPRLREKSRTLLSDTRERYAELLRAMNSAAAGMDPVLEQFKNHVLFLKHNLNARAISSLEDLGIEVQAEVADLIRRMQQSIDEADRFVSTLES